MEKNIIAIISFIVAFLMPAFAYSSDEWDKNAVYESGDIVEYNTGFYIANWWNINALPSTSSGWQQLDINMIVKPIPNPDEKNIIGEDNNGDGLRDDYAAIIEKNYTESKELVLATQAGRVFGKLLEFTENDIEITVEDAQLMAANGIVIQYCIDVYKMRNPEFLNPIDVYFDTLNRAIANRKASNKLYKSLQGNDPIVTEIDCDEFLEGFSK